MLDGDVPLSALVPGRLLLNAVDPPVQPQPAHDTQDVHFPTGLQLLTANSGGNEAASPADPCTGHSQGGDREVTGDQGTRRPGKWGTWETGDQGTWVPGLKLRRKL